MTTENDLLKAARERTASLVHPDEGLTRQELAELVNAYIWEHHQKRVQTDGNYLGKLERGIIRWPSKLYREALRAILGVPTDAALGFTNPRRAVVKLENVNRKKFLGSATFGVGALVLEGPLAALLEGQRAYPVPARVGATEIEQVRAARQVFESWSFAYGGGVAREVVLAQVGWSARLLQASCPARLRPELFSAVGDLAETAGSMAVDACAYDEAHSAFGFALACAERAGDWHLWAAVLSSMALQAICTGRPDEGLGLAKHALVRADRLTATERARLFTDQARALAKMRRVRETLIAVGTADDHFAHSAPANDPLFMAYYTAARHAQLTGQALADLAVLGRDPGAATHRLTVAVAGHITGHARSRAYSQTKLASLTMATGDPLQAVALGNAALDAAGAIRSRRTLDALRELSRHATRHQRIDEVAHLRRQIGTLLLAS